MYIRVCFLVYTKHALENFQPVAEVPSSFSPRFNIGGHRQQLKFGTGEEGQRLAEWQGDLSVEPFFILANFLYNLVNLFG